MKRYGNQSILILSWCVYTFAYTCRVNLSVALPSIKLAWVGHEELVGIIGGLFFAVYASGQLINGFLGDRFSTRKMVIFALAGSSFMNLVIGLSGNTAVTVICWAINGYFQSMLWGPLMRMLGSRFDKHESGKISVIMNTTMAFGYIITWTFLGTLVLYMQWKWVFLIPSFTGFGILSLWILFTSKEQNVSGKTPNLDVRRLLTTINSDKLWHVIIACVCLGMIKEGISLWTPTLLTEALGLNRYTAPFVSTVIPAANFFGILLAGLLIKKLKGRFLLTALIFFTCAILLSGIVSLIYGHYKIANVILIAVISAMSFGCNTIFLGFIPLIYSSYGITSTLAGIFDFSSYMGAAASSVVTGIISYSLGWRFIPLFWMAAAVTGAIIMITGHEKTIKQEASTI